MSQPHDANWVEKTIREAQERGDFDDLPGAGKPIDLGDTSDPDWWLKRYVQRENLDMSGALPAPLQLRKEAATYPAALVDVREEAKVREIITDYNRRVREEILRPAFGPTPPLVAKTLDVDEMVEGWRVLRAEHEAVQATRLEAARDAAAVAEQEQRRGWRRWFRRG